MEIFEKNEELQKEATALLKENNIVPILENFEKLYSAVVMSMALWSTET